LTTLFDNAAIATILPADHARAGHAVPKKHNLLPVLIVLFLISYGLMTLLIVEQGRTIESQRTLIHELLHDSAELAAVRSRTLQESAAVGQQQQAQMQVSPMTQSAKAPSTQIQTPSTQASSTQASSTRIQSNQVQSKQIQSTQIPPVHTQSAPSAQVTPHSRVQQHQKATQPELQAPTRPASDLADDRRAVKTI
jgi:hypothetical protein